MTGGPHARTLAALAAVACELERRAGHAGDGAAKDARAAAAWVRFAVRVLEAAALTPPGGARVGAAPVPVVLTDTPRRVRAALHASCLGPAVAGGDVVSACPLCVEDAAREGVFVARTLTARPAGAFTRLVCVHHGGEDVARALNRAGHLVTPAGPAGGELGGEG